AREAPVYGGQVRALSPQEARQGWPRRRREGCFRSLPLDAALALARTIHEPRSARRGEACRRGRGFAPAASPTRLTPRPSGGAQGQGGPPPRGAPPPPPPPPPTLPAAPP